MHVHALILSSIYPSTAQIGVQMTKEVTDDAKTSKSVFSHFSEILIPAGHLSRHSFSACLDNINAIVNALVSEAVSSVNIILNTHGKPGIHDIDNRIIIELIKRLSLNKITINTLFALLCDGFTINVPTRKDPAFDHIFWHKRRPSTTSSMAILQDKINGLITKIPQTITIRGFQGIYDPKKDKEMVINLLHGISDFSLLAQTKVESKTDIYTISKAIETCANGFKANPSEYEKAAEILKVVFEEMNHNIEAYICDRDLLKSDSSPLYQAVIEYSKLSGKISVEQFKLAYQDWKKEFKLHSTQRLGVLKQYCNEIKRTLSLNRFDDTQGTTALPVLDALNVAHGSDTKPPLDLFQYRFFCNLNNPLILDPTPIDPYHAYAMVPWNNNHCI